MHPCLPCPICWFFHPDDVPQPADPFDFAFHMAEAPWDRKPLRSTSAKALAAPFPLEDISRAPAL